ncbi:LysR substrate-binding domain-containing protein [Rhabdaerophilum sp. SD176]|jgi:DNA-binding transcriptional LysR family regulator|uniref:LysR family transcriptional regulator n=1 Tax=Rhabdaerophilum sp. SD176 TaxID=2983548 RepID=UPI0024DF708B|nr:LysR substrate-binding domain-containing protein [Rhabdaerophilum sp. SD176]
MEMHQIRYFLAVAETLNFTRAAERSHVAQPSLTRAIQKLEEELGGPLLHRERGNTHLTELGHRLLPHLRSTYEAAQSAKALARQLSLGERAPLRLGIANSLETARFRGLLDQVQMQVNGIELAMRKASGDILLEQAVIGAMDVIFLSRREQFPDRVRSWTIFCEAWMVLIPERHMLAQQTEIHPDDFEGQDLIDQITCSDRAAFLEILEQQGIRVRPRHTVDCIEDLQQLVAMGLGLGIVGQHVQPIPGVVARPLCHGSFQREVVVAIVAGRQFNRATELCVRLARMHGAS